MDEQTVRNAFLNSPYASFILDWDAKILLCNRRAEHSFCPQTVADPATLTGQPFGRLTVLEETEAVLAVRKGAAAGFVNLTMRAHRARLSKPSEFRVSLLKSNTKGQRLILLTQDQLKSTARSLRDMNHRRAALEAKLKMAKDTNAQMYQTMISMEAFAHAASHDLRTPINTLLGSLQFFTMKYQGHLPPEAMEFLDIMSRAAGQMEDMTTTLLDHSISTARHIHCEDISMRDTIEDVIADFSHVIRSAHAQVEATGDTFQVQADPMLLRMVLSNLLSNALKYKSPDRPPKITFTLAGRDARSWRLTVADNGRGFDQADTDKIFLPFHRAHLDTNGSGVGLATCAEICRRHNWLFTATAQPDAGATFSILCEAMDPA